MKGFVLFLFSACVAWAYLPPPDTVIVEGRMATTSTRPLKSYPWPNRAPVIVEHPMEGVIVSDSNGIRLVWEIRDARLHLIAADGYTFQAGAPDRSIGIGDLMPEKIKDGRVLADWYSGDFVVLEREPVKRSERVGGDKRNQTKLLIRKFRVVEGRIVAEEQERKSI
jgi:hypothetical protein